MNEIPSTGRPGSGACAGLTDGAGVSGAGLPVHCPTIARVTLSTPG